MGTAHFLEVARPRQSHFSRREVTGAWGGSRLIYSCPVHGLSMGRTLSSSTKWCLTRDMLGRLQLHFTSSPAPLPIQTLTPMHYLESEDKASTQSKYFPNLPRVQVPLLRAAFPDHSNSALSASPLTASSLEAPSLEYNTTRTLFGFLPHKTFGLPSQ